MENFELHVLLDACRKCIGQDNFVCTDHYLCISNEIIKFFNTLGLGLAFKDAEKAVKKLEIRRVTGAGCFYRRLHLLVEHEREIGDLAGTKAFFTLYRCLSFATQFICALGQAVDEERHFGAKKRLQTYKMTLASHHRGFTQSGIKLALIGAPGRRGVLSKLQQHSHGEMEPEAAVHQLTTALLSIQKAVQAVLQDTDHQVLLNDIGNEDVDVFENRHVVDIYAPEE